MALNLSEKDLEKIILVGDRVLVKPKIQTSKPPPDCTFHPRR